MVTAVQRPTRFATSLPSVKTHQTPSHHRSPSHHFDSHRQSTSGSKLEAGRTMNIAGPSRELPMPNVTRLSSLAQAHATLLHCWTKLSRFMQEANSLASAGSSATAQRRTALIDERRHFQQWLNQWETAFTAFLSSAVASMTTEDITQSRVLKTNHLACTVLASDDPPSFESEFQAIVDLSGAVLRSRQQLASGASPRSNTSTASDSSSASLRGLDVREPLIVLLGRCRQEAIRGRARELLNRFYGGDGA